MNRRELVILAGAVAAGLPTLAQGAAGTAKAGDVSDLVSSSTKCEGLGLKCLQICMDTFAKGDLGMKDCAASVRSMLALVRATADLASQNSPFLAKTAAVCLASCEDCKKQCDKHATHHAICKECAAACQECMDACKKVAA